MKKIFTVLFLAMCVWSTANVNMIKDILMLLDYVERMDYHLQRCEVDEFRTFCVDRACMDAFYEGC